MASEVFVDTSGFYALLVAKDDQHEPARRVLKKGADGGQRFVTTDYVLDETATLLKARRHARLLRPFFDTIRASVACKVEWTDPEQFDSACQFFLKHQDQAWSFTDCLSFVVMKRLRLQEALTKDAHFSAAGFTVLLND